MKTAAIGREEKDVFCPWSITADVRMGGWAVGATARVCVRVRVH